MNVLALEIAQYCTDPLDQHFQLMGANSQQLFVAPFSCQKTFALQWFNPMCQGENKSSVMKMIFALLVYYCY